MFGVILQQLLPDSYMIFPGVYALVGATSVLGGVFRASISLVIIMVEGTRGIEFIFGVILAIVVSNYVAEVPTPPPQHAALQVIGIVPGAADALPCLPAREHCLQRCDCVHLSSHEVSMCAHPQHIHHHGVYESELEQDGTIHFLRLEPPRK